MIKPRRVDLGGGIVLDMPLLVPAFSSIATAPLPHQAPPEPRPLDAACSIVHTNTLLFGIDEPILVSAYDIHHQLLTDWSSFHSGFAASRYGRLPFVIVDCGWYEKNGVPLGSSFAAGIEPPMPWSEADYLNTLDQLDTAVRAVAVSWDHLASYSEQIAHAQAMFAQRERFATSILLKVPRQYRFHNLKGLSGEDVSNLRVFDIVGVTEKELGDSVIDKLSTLASKRSRRHVK